MPELEQRFSKIPELKLLNLDDSKCYDRSGFRTIEKYEQNDVNKHQNISDDIISGNIGFQQILERVKETTNKEINIEKSNIDVSKKEIKNLMEETAQDYDYDYFAYLFGMLVFCLPSIDNSSNNEEIEVLKEDENRHEGYEVEKNAEEVLPDEELTNINKISYSYAASFN